MLLSTENISGRTVNINPGRNKCRFSALIIFISEANQASLIVNSEKGFCQDFLPVLEWHCDPKYLSDKWYRKWSLTSVVVKTQCYRREQDMCYSWILGIAVNLGWSHLVIYSEYWCQEHCSCKWKWKVKVDKRLHMEILSWNQDCSNIDQISQKYLVLQYNWSNIFKRTYMEYIHMGVNAFALPKSFQIGLWCIISFGTENLKM